MNEVGTGTFPLQASEKSLVTRRRFLRGASFGAAAIGALAAAPHLIAANKRPAVASQPAAAPSARTGSAEVPTEPVMAYVRDFATGEVAIFVGTREIILQDPELAARLMHAVA